MWLFFSIQLKKGHQIRPKLMAFHTLIFLTIPVSSNSIVIILTWIKGTTGDWENNRFLSAGWTFFSSLQFETVSHSTLWCSKLRAMLIHLRYNKMVQVIPFRLDQLCWYCIDSHRTFFSVLCNLKSCYSVQWYVQWSPMQYSRLSFFPHFNLILALWS